MILDVVYNHVGPGDEALARVRAVLHRPPRDVLGRRDRLRAARRARMGDPERRAMGARLPRRRPAARRRARDLRRLALARLRRARRARSASADALVISEMEVGDWRPIERVGPRRAVGRRARTTSCTSCSPASTTATTPDYGSVAVARATTCADAATTRGGSSICAQNHDQVGNRAVGDRLPEDALRVAAAVTLFSPCTPLLFMGEEYFETAPFQFFTDHIDPAIAEATREGRRREFADFARSRARRCPIRRRSRPSSARSSDPREPDPLYRELLALRRELPRELEADVDEDAQGPAAAARRRDARRRLRQPARGILPLMDVWPGNPFPLGPTWDGDGTNFAALLRERRARRALPLRRRRQRDARRAARRHRAQLALLRPRRRARASATATASTARTTRRPATASTRTSSSSTRTRRRSRGRCEWDRANVLPYVPGTRGGRRPRASTTRTTPTRSPSAS